MELKPGYKQTDMGVIPEDWIEKQIGELRPYVTSGSRGWAAYYSDSGDPFIRITNLTRSSIYLSLDDLRYVKIPDGDSEGARTRLRDGDVLISITADIGIIGFISAMIPDPSYINQHIALVRFDADTVFPQFISYFLASERPQKTFRALTDSGAKNGMNLSTVTKVRLSLPRTIVEQKAIALALGDADALVESLEQLLVKKRQIKQGAMQELLTGKKRLPGFTGKWFPKTIGDLLQIHHGKSQRTVEALYGPYPILATGGQIGNANRFLYDQPSVLIGRKGTIDQPRYIDEPFWCVDTLFYSTVFKPNVPKFLFYRFCLIPWKRHNEASGVPSLNARTIEQLELTVPSDDEQEAIVSVLSDIDADILAVEAKLLKSRQLKQGMMQELLTGRIRLIRPSAQVLSFPAKKSNSEAKAPHNPQINEAVVIAVLSAKFGSERFPLSRFRRTKFSYLLHRHVEHEAAGFQKMAAGPYDPNTRYGGAEKIALQNRYVRILPLGKSEGFVADENIAQAEGYFEKWYGAQTLTWLKQFHYYKNGALELLTTVDMAREDLYRDGKAATVSAVKQLIRDNPKWKPKLDRPEFSDGNIERTIQFCGQLFPTEKE